jgi:hypothetical protein
MLRIRVLLIRRIETITTFLRSGSMSNINGWTRLIKWVAAAAASALVLGACGSIRQAGSPAIESKDSVAVVTMANFTETPAAGSSAAAIAANALRQNGFADGARRCVGERDVRHRAARYRREEARMGP